MEMTSILWKPVQSKLDHIVTQKYGKFLEDGIIKMADFGEVQNISLLFKNAMNVCSDTI